MDFLPMRSTNFPLFTKNQLFNTVKRCLGVGYERMHYRRLLTLVIDTLEFSLWNVYHNITYRCFRLSHSILVFNLEDNVINIQVITMNLKCLGYGAMDGLWAISIYWSALKTGHIVVYKKCKLVHIKLHGIPICYHDGFETN